MGTDGDSVEVTYLKDIPHYRPYTRLGFPKFQYAVRDAKMNGAFSAYVPA